MQLSSIRLEKNFLLFPDVYLQVRPDYCLMCIRIVVQQKCLTASAIEPKTKHEKMNLNGIDQIRKKKPVENIQIIFLKTSISN